jgi:hypothetical protein
MPWELWLGILCEEFPGRLPTEILAEEQRLPAGLLDTVVLYRSYKRAKRTLDAADTTEKRQALEKSRLYDLVEQVEAAIVEEEIAAREQVDERQADG